MLSLGFYHTIVTFFLIFLLQINDVVFCSGQIALVPCKMELVKAATYTQAHLSFSHMKKVLEAVIGSLTLAHVVQAHCYTTRHQDIQIIRAVWESMLRATEGEKVSHSGVRFLFVKFMPEQCLTVLSWMQRKY